MALAFAAFGVACSGRTSSVKMSEERTDSALKANETPSMALIGCVKPASTSGEGHYILDHVTMPPDEIRPESSSSRSELIPRGSWVRLGGPDMHQYLGKEVLVSGNLAEAPSGTAGHGPSGQPGDYVRWNGKIDDVPLLAVETVKEQGRECKGG
jgi:hypothetical protein